MTNQRPPFGLQASFTKAAAGVSLALSAVAANAQVSVTEIHPELLEQVLVTATRLAQPLNKVARSISVVGPQELLSIQPKSVAEALAYQPNTTASGGPRAENQIINMRGLQGSKVLQTIDGARQSFESGHRPSYFLDPELLKSVEAVRGPASSLWGSGAIGGVVAQNTITASDLVEGVEGLGGFAKAGYNGNNRGVTTTAALAGTSRSVGWLLSGYRRDSDDIEQGNGERLMGSGSDSMGGMGKLNWQIDAKQELEFSYRYAKWNGSVPSNSGASLEGTSNFLIDREQAAQNMKLAYLLDSDSELLNLEMMIYNNKVDMDEARVSDGRDDNTQIDTSGMNITNVSEFGANRVLLGIDTYKEKFTADRGGFNRPEPPKAESTAWSAYALAEISLSQNWALELGLRYDDFVTEAGNLGTRSSDSAVSPSAAIVWDAADWLTLSMRHDRAFRAPGAEELYSTGSHFCLFPGFCNSFMPNPELAPERAANSELNAKLAFVNVAGADAIHVTGAIFHNKVDDFIEQVVVAPSFRPVMNPGLTTWNNVEAATLEGAELSASYLRGGFSIKASYGVVRGTDDNSRDDLSYIPADTFKLDGAYRYDSLGLVTGLRYRRAAAQERTNYAENTNRQRYESYGITDLYASWQSSALPGLRLDLNINNLEDKYYRQAWEELYEAGREVVVSMRFQF